MSAGARTRPRRRIPTSSRIPRRRTRQIKLLWMGVGQGRHAGRREREGPRRGADGEGHHSHVRVERGPPRVGRLAASPERSRADAVSMNRRESRGVIECDRTAARARKDVILSRFHRDDFIRTWRAGRATVHVSNPRGRTLMRSSQTVVAAALVLGAALTLHAVERQSPPPQSPPSTTPPSPTPAAGEQRPAAPGGPPQGRGGGGRGNPTGALYTENCAGCHGTGRGRPRARACSTTSGSTRRRRVDRQEHPRTGSRTRKWLRSRRRWTSSRSGSSWPTSGTQARQPEGEAGLRSRSRRPGHQVGETDVQDRDRREGPRDAVGPGVSARRPAARDRASRAPAHRREGQAASRRRSRARRRCGRSRTAGCSTSRSTRSTRRNGWIYISYSEDPPGLHTAAASAACRSTAAGSGRACLRRSRADAAAAVRPIRRR